MRNRRNSGARLDYFQRIVRMTILDFQHPVTGLLPATRDHQHAWIRDNVYSIMAVWGLSLAYKKNADADDDMAKAYELEMCTVKCMRGLLACLQCQLKKLEKFKVSQSKEDSFHAKFGVATGQTVVTDQGWGHLQLDAISLYLLTLAQMTASGLRIVATMAECTFVQNLVFYIESTYRVPDFGIWERGDKTNHGVPELNASSIGMAKAALEALDGLDLFGSRGGTSSVIHVPPDEIEQCDAVLASLLPRESISKEVDASLLGVIGYPAFAVDDMDTIEKTRGAVCHHLLGKYGCSRFQRDGYLTPREDSSRLYYEPWELAGFDGIESEWPLFFAYFVLNAMFSDDRMQAEDYLDQLEKLMITSSDGVPLMPELYTLPAELVDAELKQRGSQGRLPAGKCPHMWGESLYIVARLLYERLLSAGELDPLNRRLISACKPDLVVQVVVLAENQHIQERLAHEGIDVQTLAEVAPIRVLPAKALGAIYSLLGKNSHLGLTGRLCRDVGPLSTSKLYTIEGEVYAFMSQLVDVKNFYLAYDIEFLVDKLRTHIAFLKASWKMFGRPVIVVPIRNWVFVQHVGDARRTMHPALVGTILKLKSGYVNGCRVSLSRLSDLLTTSCVMPLDFLTETAERREWWSRYSRRFDQPSRFRSRLFSEPFDADLSLPRPASTSNAATEFFERLAERQLAEHAALEEGAGSSQHSGGTVEQRRVASAMRLEGVAAGVDGVGMMMRRRSVPMGDTLEPPSSSAPPKDVLFDLPPSPTRTDGGGDIFAAFDGTTPRGSLGFQAATRTHLLTVPSFTDPLSPEIVVNDVSGMPSAEPSSRATSGLSTPVSSAPQRDAKSVAVPRLKSGVVGESSGYSMSVRSGSLKDNVVGSLDMSAPKPEGAPAPGLAAKYAGFEVDGLVETLANTENLYEQIDILTYLYQTRGLEWDTRIGGAGCSVKELLFEVYEKAGNMKLWWLVRHVAAMLNKRIDVLAQAVTDLLVRQKQLSVGLPPAPRERVILSPLPPHELGSIIRDACAGDPSTAMLTQELILYLSMFIRTEPNLFREMLRLRVGLIIHVMATELAGALNCSGDEAAEQLLSLSPFEVKTFLHQILSGKELSVTEVQAQAHSAHVLLKPEVGALQPLRWVCWLPHPAHTHPGGLI